MATVIQVPTRRRRAQAMFTPEQLSAFAEALPTLADNQAVLIADADTEGEARYAARIAQEELRSQFGLDSRTNVFEHEGRHRAALRRKHGTARAQAPAAEQSAHAPLPESGEPTPAQAPAPAVTPQA